MSAASFPTAADRQQLEEGLALTPKFNQDGLLPAIATDHETGELLMVAYMNAEALSETIRRREAVFYSRSRKELWHKGGTSGHVLKVKDLRMDCDQDAVWLIVENMGPGCCHVGYRSCFYRSVDLSGGVSENGEAALLFKENEKAYDAKKVYGK
jgi:phosphoribosyl-AMP cyclohydrolase